jgi:hypothetical protein
MSYSLAEAAQPTGLNRDTILRAIKSGKISGQRDAQDAWTIEPVELHRVFAASWQGFGRIASASVPEPKLDRAGAL